MRTLAFLIGGYAIGALPGPKQFSVNGTLIQRFVDDEAGVVCYFVPRGWDVSPSISCVRVSP